MPSPAPPPLLDRTAACELLGGDEELLDELTDLFLGDVEDRLEAIDRALRDGDAFALRSSAHTLKGAAATVGAVAVTARALEVEDLGAAGEEDGLDRVAAAEATGALLETVRATVAEIGAGRGGGGDA